jgi:30S ribosomal protein S31
MGKGDRKTRKGKISIRSYGNSRPHTEKKDAAAVKPAAAVKTAAKPAAAKKAAPAAKKKA